jgi:hypothetical protein
MSEADYYGAEIDKYTEHLLDSIYPYSKKEVTYSLKEHISDEPKDKEGVGSVPIIVRESSHHRTILVCSVLENGAVDKEVVITRGR